MWIETTRDDPEWYKVEYVRGGISLTYYHDYMQIEGDVGIIRHERKILKTAEREKQEFKLLLKRWEKRGKTELANAFRNFNNDWGSLWDEFEELTGEIEVEETRIDLSDPAATFYKLDTTPSPWPRPGFPVNIGGSAMWNPASGTATPINTEGTADAL